MPTPAQMREQSRLCIEKGKKEPRLDRKRALARKALALAQLAEQIERDVTTQKKKREPIE